MIIFHFQQLFSVDNVARHDAPKNKNVLKCKRRIRRLKELMCKLQTPLLPFKSASHLAHESLSSFHIQNITKVSFFETNFGWMVKIHAYASLEAQDGAQKWKQIFEMLSIEIQNSNLICFTRRNPWNAAHTRIKKYSREIVSACVPRFEWLCTLLHF